MEKQVRYNHVRYFQADRKIEFCLSRRFFFMRSSCQVKEFIHSSRSLSIHFKQQEENVSIHVAILKEDLAFNWVLLNAKQTNFYTFKYFAKKRAKLKINTAQSWELNADPGVDRV